MRIYSDLFGKTVALHSLLEAWDKFKAGKRHRPDVQLFERNLEDNLFILHEDLIQKRYRHSPYSSFYIQDPKVRLIHKSTVRDRIVHHAVFKTLNAIFEPTFIFDSYSCREGKGAHRAVQRLKFFADRIYRMHQKCFVLKCDIEKFFHSIDHEILLSMISKRIKDTDLINLIQELIHSFSAETAARQERERERERAVAQSATSLRNSSPISISTNWISL